MKKITLIISLNIFILVFLLVILPSFTIKKRQGTSISNGSNTLSFIQKNPISFSFISNYSNLESLTIDLKNPMVLNNSKIIFKIIGPNSEREINFYGKNVGDPSSVPLKFTPFLDPPGTNYLVSLTTDNTDHSSLYLITDKNQQPVFNSFYSQSNIKNNIKYNLQRQLNLFQKRSQIHNIVYFSLIIILNCLVIIL